ncbi:MAG: CBS domain-containing protein [Streptosporangiales bacterium]|nr:CBS domain-containing protein [Streptosporangiales bacterium]
MLVREAMTAPAVTVPVTATVRQAIKLLYDNDITAVPVVDDSGRMVGIVSETDLLRGEFEADPRAFLRPPPATEKAPPNLVEEVMTRRVLTTRETADVADVAGLMMSAGVKSVPVLRGRQIVGVVSRRDLIAVLARADHVIRADVVAALADYDQHGAGWEVSVHDGVVELRGQADERTERVAELLTRTVSGVVRVDLVHT